MPNLTEGYCHSVTRLFRTICHSVTPALQENLLTFHDKIKTYVMFLMKSKKKWTDYNVLGMHIFIAAKNLKICDGMTQKNVHHKLQMKRPCFCV